MPQVSVSFPVSRHIDPEKVTAIVAAAGRAPIKTQLIHKSNAEGEIDLFGLLKFDCSTKADAKKVFDALAPLGEVRSL